jgi:hypothetical protein
MVKKKETPRLDEMTYLQRGVRVDDEFTAKPISKFGYKQDKDIWIEWKKREKELELKEPKCTCKLKDYKHGYHYMKCPYLNYWSDAWIKFADDFRNKRLSPTGLDLWMK